MYCFLVVDCLDFSSFNLGNVPNLEGNVIKSVFNDWIINLLRGKQAFVRWPHAISYKRSKGLTLDLQETH